MENGSHYVPYDPKLTALARENRKNPTVAERRMWYKVLQRRQFQGLKFLRQKPICSFVVDFYCSELLLAIEIDGDSHATNEEYDRRRTRVLGGYGITVARYTNDDVLRNTEGVAEHLTEVVARLSGGRRTWEQ